MTTHAQPAPRALGPVLHGRTLACVAAAVLLLHVCSVDEAVHRLQALRDDASVPSIARMDVSFVRTLSQAEPPAAPARAVVLREGVARKRASTTRAPSSASAQRDESGSTTPPSGTGEVAGSDSPPSTPNQDAQAQAQADDASRMTSETSAEVSVDRPADAKPGAGAPNGEGNAGFEWPPSTRLEFGLTGSYQGPIEGNARVQWVRKVERYQVHMDVFVGPEIAPIMARRMTSDGVLDDVGLVPERYEEVTRVGFTTRRNAVSMGADTVTLTNGQSRARPTGLQDSASQFVQLSFLFTTQPSLLTVGRSITIPVALPRRVDPWIYDVLAEEHVETAFGPVRAFHVKPRRESPRPGELVAQAWFAPSLQYLPVRIFIQQDKDSFVDLLLRELPSQAARSER